MSEASEPAMQDLSDVLGREVSNGDAQRLIADLTALADESLTLDSIAAQWLADED